MTNIAFDQAIVMTEKKETRSEFWLRLDNAAKIYPSIKNRETTSVMRISIELKERIKAKQFMEAIHSVEDRFPYYKMKLKSGFFWYYLEYENLPIQISADSGTPCRKFNKDEMMFRILVRENRLSVEFSHIITDGTGAFEFVKTLLFTYFEKSGIDLPDCLKYYHPGETASEEEYEDAYNRYFKKTTSSAIKVPRAFHLPLPLRAKPGFNILMGSMPMNEVIAKSKENNISLTGYLIAVYLQALQEVYSRQPSGIRKKCDKNVRIEVPVNLRNIYPSRTMRNFSLYVTPEIDLRLGKYTFDELIKIVYHQMQLQTDKKLINKMISRNVGSERNLFIKSMPLLLKSLVLSRVYIQVAEGYSGVLTNLGKIDFSPEINNLIKRIIFIPPPANEIVKVNCGVSGFDNKLILSFGSIAGSNQLERYFFSYLTSQGIPVKIEKYQ